MSKNRFNYLALMILEKWGLKSPTQTQIDAAEDMVQAIVTISDSDPMILYRLKSREDFIGVVLDIDADLKSHENVSFSHH